MLEPISVALSPCSRTLRTVVLMLVYALIPTVLFAALPVVRGYASLLEGPVSKLLADADDTLERAEHALASPHPHSPPSPPLQSDGTPSREIHAWEESQSRVGVVPFDEAAYGTAKSAEARAVLEGMRALCASVVEAPQQSECNNGREWLRNWIISMLEREVSDARRSALSEARDAQLLRCGKIMLLPPLERLVATMRALEPISGGAASGATPTRAPLRPDEANARAREYVANLSALHRAKFWETHPSAAKTPDHWLYLTPGEVAQLSVAELGDLAEHHARRKTVQLFKHFGILPARQCVEWSNVLGRPPFSLLADPPLSLSLSLSLSLFLLPPSTPPTARPICIVPNVISTTVTFRANPSHNLTCSP